MDDQIAEAKDHALSRKDILEKVDKWKFASEEECWLDDYERVILDVACYYVPPAYIMLVLIVHRTAPTVKT